MQSLVLQLGYLEHQQDCKLRLSAFSLSFLVFVSLPLILLLCLSLFLSSIFCPSLLRPSLPTSPVSLYINLKLLYTMLAQSQPHFLHQTGQEQRSISKRLTKNLQGFFSYNLETLENRFPWTLLFKTRANQIQVRALHMGLDRGQQSLLKVVQGGQLER